MKVSKSNRSFDAQDSTAPQAELELKRSMNAVLATMFLSALGFTIFIPMLWFYYQNFSECLCSCAASPVPSCSYCTFPNATVPDTNGACDCPQRDQCAFFLGFIVSGFPLGQFVFSPVFGWWGARRSMREVLVFSLVVNAIGYVMFSVVSSGWLLLFARFVIGMGGANTAVLRTYASIASSEENRTATMAKMSAAQSFGFLLGPGLGFLFAFKQFSFTVAGLIVNQYTAAGFAAALIIIINLILLVIFFKDIKPSAGADSFASSAPAKMDVPATVTLMLFFFSCVFVFSVYEGVATQITEINYDWQWKLNGIYLTACGAMSIAGFLALKPLETKIGSRQVMVMALALSALSYIPLCDKLFPNTFVPLWAYIISSLMLSFGYPTAQAMSLVLFTKIVPPSRQGVMMGLLTSTGSVARMLGPAWGTYAFNIVNNQTYLLAFSCFGLLFFIIMLTAVMWNRIVSKQSSTLFSINASDELHSQQQRLLSNTEDDDEGPAAPYSSATGISLARPPSSTGRLSRNSRRASHDDGIDFSMGVVSKMVQDLDSLNDDR